MAVALSFDDSVANVRTGSSDGDGVGDDRDRRSAPRTGVDVEASILYALGDPEPRIDDEDNDGDGEDGGEHGVGAGVAMIDDGSER